MILFIDKKTGEIRGTIQGRVHTDAHLKMWIGDKNSTERVVIPWKKVIDGEEEIEKEVMQKVGKDVLGNSLYKKAKVKEKVAKSHWEPDFPQKELIMDIERRKEKLTNYKLDLKSRKLIPDGEQRSGII